MKGITKGYILGAVAAISYGTNPLFAVPLYEMGMSVPSVLFYRYLIATVLLGLVMIKRGSSFRLSRRQVPLMFVQGVLFALSSVGLFEAYNYMDVGIASTMLFVEPIFIALILWIFYRQRISVSTAIAIAVSFAGVVLLANPGPGANVSALGVVLVMLSALSYSVYMILISKTSLQRLAGPTLTFYSLLFGLSVFIVQLKGLTALQPVPVNPLGIGCAVGLSVVPTIVSILTVAVAVQLIGSVPVSILGALEPVTGVLVGVLVFGEFLTFKAVLGIVLILAAVFLLVTSPQKLLRNGKAMFHHFRMPGRR
ncbi:DMT family transporter [uncultured Duncaniella sp.]|jgi:drug/metabolite transporter (DMT)-like permease|uniref:DMT family transporter n=1 Tax=uncultured Duncaniella sp. TaxID=2768039 RepID=UPI0026768BF7|nr:EamA family transporter [uncultured Duncaniella sp.]MCI9172436.1 EamA family transporter [Muribaculaceae bacterium]